MHLFAGIEQKRADRKASADFRLTGGLLLLGASLLIAGMAWLYAVSPSPFFPAEELSSGAVFSEPVPAAESRRVVGRASNVSAHPLLIDPTGALPPASLQAPPVVPAGEGPSAGDALVPVASPALLATETREEEETYVVSATAMAPKPNREAPGENVAADANFGLLTPLGQQWNLFRRSPQLFADKSCEDFKGQPLRWYLDWVFSPDIALRNLTPQSEEYTDYANRRNDTESFRFAFSTGLRLTAKSGMGLGMRVGLNYSEILENFDYQNENEVRIIIKEVYDQQGNILGTDTTYEYGTRIKRTSNHYRMLDVPVMVGYELEFPKLTLALYGGAYFNLALATQGDFLSPELDPVTFTTGKSEAYPAFRDQLGLSLGGSVGIYYQLSERWQVILEPQFRYFLQPVTREDYLLNQKYFTTGINAGLRLKL